MRPVSLERMKELVTAQVPGVDPERVVKVLGAPIGMTKEECGDLPVVVTDGGRHCISAWEVTEKDLEALKETGVVWLWCFTGDTQPPVSLVAGFIQDELENEPPQLRKIVTGVRLIAQERTRQKVEEGYEGSHDADHDPGTLADAAACYAAGRSLFESNESVACVQDPVWPWSSDWWKPKTRLRDLVRAGALIAAEIDKYLAETAVCLVCGCTEEDCSVCIEETGVACHWVKPGLCSRCAGEEEKSDDGAGDGGVGATSEDVGGDDAPEDGD